MGENLTKEQILSMLYCIRAGLSEISKHKDELCAKEKNIASLNESIDTNAREIENKRNERRALKENLSSTNEDQKNNKRKKKLTIFKILLMALTYAFYGIFVTPAVSIFVIGPIIMLVPKLDKEYGGDTFMIFLFGAIVCMIVGFIIGFIVTLVQELSTNKETEESLHTAEVMARGNIAKVEGELKIIEAKNAKLKTEHVNSLDEYDKTKNAVIPISSVIYNSLAAEFSRILDPRDWANLDLIIFYYETGRAETIKEALQQVDRQRQTDSLIAEIKKASESISKSIRLSINSLRADLNTCFLNLSTQLSVQHKEHMAQLSSATSMMDKSAADISSRLKSVSGEINLQNALLAKISTDSAELAKDAEYLIYYKKPSYIA